MAAVLIIDDDGAVRQLVKLILQQKGYEVLLASNGLEGLMVYSTYHSRIDLVLTDIDMPEMNGIELANRIRDREPSKNILLMSGRPVGDPQRPDVPILPKPFRPDQLIDAVEAALGAAGDRGPGAGQNRGQGPGARGRM
jgi:two-component system, cell cycle sensor histidine kinase and response regulator CckA